MNIETNHTPGPWLGKKSINAHDQGLVVEEATGKNVAVVYDGARDTALIAAAPELLDHLKGVLALVELDEDTQEQYAPILNSARAAIAEAEGRAE